MMDPPSPIEQQVYVDIESVINEGLSQLDPPSSGEKTKLCDQLSMSVDDDPLLLGNSNSVMVLMDGGKEKRKKGSISAKKPPKPPRTHPHRGFSLDAADEKLIKELAQLAMIKRARIERMKALMQKKASKAASSSSSSNATVFAMLFTIIFFIVILLQGMSCQNSHGTLEGSPQTSENSLIYIQGQLNPSTHTSV